MSLPESEAMPEQQSAPEPGSRAAVLALDARRRALRRSLRQHEEQVRIMASPAAIARGWQQAANRKLAPLRDMTGLQGRGQPVRLGLLALAAVAAGYGLVHFRAWRYFLPKRQAPDSNSPEMARKKESAYEQE